MKTVLSMFLFSVFLISLSSCSQEKLDKELSYLNKFDVTDAVFSYHFYSKKKSDIGLNIRFFDLDKKEGVCSQSFSEEFSKGNTVLSIDLNKKHPGKYRIVPEMNIKEFYESSENLAMVAYKTHHGPEYEFGQDIHYGLSGYVTLKKDPPKNIKAFSAFTKQKKDLEVEVEANFPINDTRSISCKQDNEEGKLAKGYCECIDSKMVQTRCETTKELEDCCTDLNSPVTLLKFSYKAAPCKWYCTSFLDNTMFCSELKSQSEKDTYVPSPAKEKFDVASTYLFKVNNNLSSLKQATDILISSRLGNRDEAMEKLLFYKKGSSDILFSHDKLFLIVDQNGSKAVFNDEKLEEEKLYTSGYTKLSYDELKQMGKRFINTHLSRFISNKEFEEIVPYSFSYIHESGYNVETGAETSRVVENEITFTRKINGVPVVGPGSKIRLRFTNDGSLVAYKFNWANIEKTDEIQYIASQEDINSRIASFNSCQRTAYNVKVDSIECGLYDSGFGISGTTLQPACEVMYAGNIQQQDGVFSFAKIDFIPSGVDMKKDSNWIELQKFMLSGNMCTDSQLSIDEKFQPDEE